MLQLAYGSSFGDAAANAEYRRIGAMIYAKCVLALKRDFPVIWCDNCHEATTIVSVNPNFQYRRTQNVSDEFIYFRPIDAEIREKARRKKQQKPTMASRQHDGEEYGCPRTPRNLWLESPENAESPGSDDLEVARSMYPLRERSIFRRSWAELLEAPLNSEGLHIVQTIPTEEDREIGYLELAPEEENQATTPPRDPYLHPLQGPFPLLPQRPKLQRQRSHSLPRYSDSRREKLNPPELTLNPEKKHFFFPSDNLFTGENSKERNRIEEAWQKDILSGSGEHPPINPNFEYSSTMKSKIGIPEDNVGLPKGNVRIPSKNVMVNVGVPIDNSEVLRSNAGVLMCNPEIPSGNGRVPWGSGVGVPMDNVDYLRHNVGTSRHTISSLLTELSKIGEHQL
ncbi:connector enhancer of kinase suppressor of ras 2-like [Sciurus carolinensis]|uniref:connector enhancer of kinase suppressor of ras 2-like n=1 Tax=Sciurus carolinensis TaxID=30640 RepID=UPI001FB1EC92|nr:connector enhancer of kinase suppressor of ras 2-like [Sciurus carolinensis]